MRVINKIKILFPLFLLLSGMAAFAQARSPFTVTAPSGTVLVKGGETKTVSIRIAVPEGHFIYADKTALQFHRPDGFAIGDVQYPKSRSRLDPFFKKEANVFTEEVVLTVSLTAPQRSSPGKKTVEGMLTFQGCSDKLCYPEESHLISLSFDVGEGAGGMAVDAEGMQRPAIAWRDLLRAQSFEKIFEQHWGVVLLVIFLGGFLTSLTPCVLPIIPITLLIIGVRAEAPWRRNFLLSLSLVLGLSLSYALLGIGAVSLGKTLGFVFQQQWFLILLAFLFLFFALSMFGLFEIHLPQKLHQRLNQIKGHGLLGAFVSGTAAGVLAAPCAGPVIGALLLFVAGTKNYAQGFGLLFLFALGMGTLFLILGTLYGTLQARFGNLKFTLWVKKFLAILLLIGALFYLNAAFSIDKKLDSLFGTDPVVWVTSEEEGLRQAKEKNKIILLDFYADWCAPCKELSLHFFRRDDVVPLLEKMIPIRIDATFNNNSSVVALIQKYNVVGWPTVLFLRPDGTVIQDLTVVAYNPDLLLENMKKALATTQNPK